MKKTIASLLATAMLVATMPMAMAADPASISELVKKVTGGTQIASTAEVLDGVNVEDVLVDIKVREESGTYVDDYSTTKENAATTVDMIAELETSILKQVYDVYIQKAMGYINTYGGSNKAVLLAELEDAPVTGKFTVTANIPAGITLPDTSKIKFGGKSFGLYKEVSRNITGNSTTGYTATFEIEVDGMGDTGYTNKAELDTWLAEDLYLECTGATIADFGKYKITGNITGYTLIGDVVGTQEDESYVKITYYGKDEATIEINKSEPGSGRPNPGTIVKPEPIEPIKPVEPEVPELLEGGDHFAYIVGYPNGTVQPMGNISRAEVATILFRLLKDEVRDGNLKKTNNFTDVKENDWFNAAVSTLVGLGIVKGRTADTFAPDAPITRAEFATLCARFDNTEVEIADAFTDDNGHWAEGYINRAAAIGWVEGYNGGIFRPDKNITRAEAMTLVNRVLKRNPETPDDLLDNMNKWSDNSNESAWYYIAVQEATNSHNYGRKENGTEKWTEIKAPRDWTTYEK